MSGCKLVYNHFSHKGEQGRHTGESTLFPPRWPGFVSQQCQTWIKFVVGCRPFCKGFLPRLLRFPPSSSLFLPLQKPTWPNSNFDLETEDEQLLCGGATAKSHLFIYFFVNVFFIYFIYHTYICYFEENVQSILMRNVVAVVQELLADWYPDLLHLPLPLPHQECKDQCLQLARLLVSTFWMYAVTSPEMRCPKLFFGVVKKTFSLLLSLLLTNRHKFVL